MAQEKDVYSEAIKLFSDDLKSHREYVQSIYEKKSLEAISRSEETVKILTDDLQKHREYVQKLYVNAFIIGGAGLIIAIGVIYWAFGKQFDSKMIDYVVEENVGTRIETISQEAIDAAQKSVKAAIDSAQAAAIQKVDDYSKETVGIAVETTISDRLGKVAKEDLPELIKSVTFPSGMVAAFNREKCPQGWSQFAESDGRLLVGTTSDLSAARLGRTFSLGATGGEYEHTLSLLEIPSHSHSISTGYGPGWHSGLVGGNNDVARGIDSTFNNPDPRIRRDGGHGVLPDVLDRVGGSRPHNNMPPFLVVNFCSKD